MIGSSQPRSRRIETTSTRWSGSRASTSISPSSNLIAPAATRLTEPPLDAEIGGLRVGDFRLVTFPGLVSGVGLDVKRAAAHPTAFVAGYTNGYLHYLPTGRQRANTGYAQEDCDCLVAPEWEQIFRDGAKRMFSRLGAE